MTKINTLSTWFLNRFSRVTTSGEIIPVVDGLRFIAITSVVLFHLSHYTGASESRNVFAMVAQVGWIGVELFFVISGFILAKGFSKYYLVGGRPVSLKLYYLRRVTRLEPTYIAALLIYFISKATLLQKPDLIKNLLASIGYSHNILYGKQSEILGVAWSLEVEVQFYILAPLISMIFLIRPHRLRRLLLCGLIFGLNILAHLIDLGILSLINYLHLFLVGYLLCDIYVLDWKNGARIPKTTAWDMVSLTAWTALILCLTYLPFRWFYLPWIILIAYIGAFKGTLSSRIFSIPFVFVVGGMCYTIYLYHTAFIRILVLRTPLLVKINDLFGGFWAFPVISLIALPFILACSSLLFFILEKPFMYPNWPQKVYSRITIWVSGMKLKNSLF